MLLPEKDENGGSKPYKIIFRYYIFAPNFFQMNVVSLCAIQCYIRRPTVKGVGKK